MYAISYPSGKLYKDGIEIEQREDNPVWQEYFAWLKQDNTPATLKDARIYPSIKVTAWQLIQALAQKGMLETVDATANASSDILMRMGWQRAPNFISDDPMIMALCAVIGIDQDARQDVFELASTF